jgi:hypothetical protein
VAQCGKLVASGINRVWRSGSARLVGRESSWVSVRPRPLRYAVEVCHVSPGTARASSSTRPSRAAAAQMYSTAVYQTSTSPGSWKQRLVRAACFLNFLPRRPVLVPVRPHALQLFGRPCPDSYTFFTAPVGFYYVRETHVPEETDTGCCSSIGTDVFPGRGTLVRFHCISRARALDRLCVILRQR